MEYRIDYSTEKIYVFEVEYNAYTFLCTFHVIGATRKNRVATIERKLKESGILL